MARTRQRQGLGISENPLLDTGVRNPADTVPAQAVEQRVRTNIPPPMAPQPRQKVQARTAPFNNNAFGPMSARAAMPAFTQVRNNFNTPTANLTLDERLGLRQQLIDQIMAEIQTQQLRQPGLSADPLMSTPGFAAGGPMRQNLIHRGPVVATPMRQSLIPSRPVAPTFQSQPGKIGGPGRGISQFPPSIFTTNRGF